ncbi:MBL fold metallo-hydrolase [Halanaerocella petrolearia]
MELIRQVVGVGDVNCYIIIDKTNKGIIIDPGGETEKLLTKIKQKEIDLKAIILTHCHYDHILGVKKLKQKLDLPVWIHKQGAVGLTNAEINLSANRTVPTTIIKPDRKLENGEVLEIGSLKIEIIHTPGHTAGGICLKINNKLLTGDTLFKNSVGRTDLPTSNYQDLVDSVINKLLILNDNLKVYPGHGPTTTLAREKRKNPKVRRIIRKY